METVGSPFSTFAAVTREHCARSATSASGRLRRSLAIRICSPTVRSFAEILLGNKTDLVALVINKLDAFVVCDLFIIHCYIHDTSACSSRSRTMRRPGISFSKKRLLSLEEKMDSSDHPFPASVFPTNLDADPRTVAASPTAAAPFAAMIRASQTRPQPLVEPV